VLTQAAFDVGDCSRINRPVDQLLAAMTATAALLGCAVRQRIADEFQPHGATCVLILAESHLVVSTWPEYQYASIDLCTCRADVDPVTSIDPILRALGGTLVHAVEVPRFDPRPKAAPSTAPRTELSHRSRPLAGPRRRDRRPALS